MTAPGTEHSYRSRITLFFWASVVAGLSLPGIVAIAVEVVRDGASPAAAIDEWVSHLFLPGYNEFLLAVMHAAPFAVLAVGGMLALSSGWSRGQRDFRVRFVAALSSLAVAVAVSLWTLVSIRASRSSTAAIGYIFIPFLILAVLPFAWFGGWAAGRRMYPAGPVPPGSDASAPTPRDSSPPASA